MKNYLLASLLLLSTTLSAQVRVLPKDLKNINNGRVLPVPTLHILNNPLCEYRPNKEVKYIYYDAVNVNEITGRNMPESGEYITLYTIVGGKQYTLIPSTGTDIGLSDGMPQNLKMAEPSGYSSIPGSPRAATLWKVTISGGAYHLTYNGGNMHEGTLWGVTGGYMGLQNGIPKVGMSNAFNLNWQITPSIENGSKILQLQNTGENKLLGYCYSTHPVNTPNGRLNTTTQISPTALSPGSTSTGRACGTNWFYKIYRVTKATGNPKYTSRIKSGTYCINSVLVNKSLAYFLGAAAFGTTNPSADYMQWQFEKTSRGTYFLINKTNGKALSVTGPRLQLKFVTINTSNFCNSDSMQWILRGPYEGKYSFTPVLNINGAGSGKVLTTKNAVAVDLEPYVSGSYWQEFMIDSVNGPLWGYVDMHTHLMSHLAFAGKVFHGAPDIGSLMYPGTIYRDQGFNVGEEKKDCNTGFERARTVADALGSCNATHGGPGPDNNCGDYLRNGFIRAMEGMQHGSSAHGSQVYGYSPDRNLAFTSWPKWNDMTHQKMWIDWLRMAYSSGLRVMVALAHNNQVMADIVAYNDATPKDDKTIADQEVREIISFVNRHRDFMEIAYSSADLYRIVKSNKLAIIAGLEIDFIGNFSLNMEDNAANRTKVDNELNRLYANGVRYIFPIHMVNNAFGGTAIYEDIMNVLQKIGTGQWWQIECSKPQDLITHQYKFGIDRNITNAIQRGLPMAPALLEGINALLPLPPGIKEAAQPIISSIIQGTFATLTPALQAAATLAPDAPPGCGPNIGHKNKEGLTPIGKYAIRKMMQKGILIDIDHMSQYSANATLDMAKSIGYPVNSGHTGLRPGDENHRTIEQLKTITDLGGLFGVGWSGQDAGTWVDIYKRGISAMKNRGVCFGSDMNSLVFTPKPRQGSHVQYNSFGFPAPASFGHTWDYNRDGMAQYGMVRDFIRDIRNMGDERELNVLFSSSNEFFKMWKKCESGGR